MPNETITRTELAAIFDQLATAIRTCTTYSQAEDQLDLSKQPTPDTTSPPVAFR